MTDSKKDNSKITKEMLIGDILQSVPAAAEIMMQYGLHCIGCHVSTYESLEMGAKSHGLPDDEIDEMVEAINEEVENSN